MSLLKTVIETKEVKNVIHVIKALPLYHFIKEDLKPYEPFSTPLKAIKWGDTELKMSIMKVCLDSKSG